MTGVSVRVEVKDAAVQAALGALLARAGDLTPAMDEIGGALVASVLARFETGAAPGGAPWIPSRRALAEGGQTLVKSGRLRASITHLAGPDSVTVGTNVVYAAIHQFGGRAGRGRKTALPARPFLGLDAGDEAEIVRILREHLVGGVA
jgi:phage virion morphogenesis protein